MKLISIDPTGKFKERGVPEQNLIPAIGILPIWLINGDPELSAKEVFDQAYNFGLFEMTGGKIDDDGIYHYPEDEPLYPIAKIERGAETIYFYEMAIVGIVSLNSQFVTRMD